MHIEPILRALADPTRLRIMRLLATMELAVGEMAQVLGQSQPRVSRHIRILVDAGLAERRKEGSWVFLQSAIREDISPSLASAVARMLAAGEAGDSGFAARCGEDRRHLAAIRATRQTAADAWFARHAGQWDQIRRLHSPDETVEAALLTALGDLGGTWLDIGTGTGRMAELLAGGGVLSAGHRPTQITGLDKSPDMLRIARARLQNLPAGAVTLVQGDFLSLPFADASFDTVLLHQVLHFAQDPQAVLVEAARVTRHGGRIAIVDFAAHDREELRKLHAHARLGFSDEQMLALLTVSGFAPGGTYAIAGQPLTVKIWIAERRALTASFPAPGASFSKASL